MGGNTHSKVCLSIILHLPSLLAEMVTFSGLHCTFQVVHARLPGCNWFERSSKEVLGVLMRTATCFCRDVEDIEYIGILSYTSTTPGGDSTFEIHIQWSRALHRNEIFSSGCVLKVLSEYQWLFCAGNCAASSQFTVETCLSVSQLPS